MTFLTKMFNLQLNFQLMITTLRNGKSVKIISSKEILSTGKLNICKI
jgi:hypothetical protein